MNGPLILDRRRVLAGSGALIVSFSLSNAFAQDQAPAPPPAQKPPGSLATAPYLDAWIRIDADGSITIFTGKVELGQGILTALAQIAADELDLPLARVYMIAGDTARTPDEGQTLLVFIGTWRLAHKDKFRIGIAGAKNNVRSF